MLTILAAAVCAGAESVMAHGDIDEQIAQVSREIQKAPTAILYLKRAELHREHEAFADALVDCDTAAKLDPELVAVVLSRGRALFQTGELAGALKALNDFLEKKPDHAEAHLIRARIHGHLKDYAAAVQDFDRAIALWPEPKPDGFLERADALFLLGKTDEAITSLDQGIKKLGNVLVLQAAALNLELEEKHYDAALTRVDRILSSLPRKEVWQARRGEILTQAGRSDDALAAYREAMASIEALTSHQRNMKPTQELEARLRRILKTVPKPQSEIPANIENQPNQ